MLQADGGTRCAAISGAWVAARRALDRFGLAKAMPGSVAAVSLGIVGGELLLDLDYVEDSGADVDLNVVITGDDRLVEVQATAERVPFGRDQLDELLELADKGSRGSGRHSSRRSMRLVAEIPSLDWLDVLFRLAVAAALGAAIGLERELDEKAAGLRTHMLVSLGAALFTMVGAYGFEDFAKGGVSTDPSRIAAQVVTGIGFLGAGVIFRQGFTVRGLTTAASLWVVAAIGMASGAGFWKGAVVGTVVGIVSLRPLEWLKERAIPQRAAARLSVELVDGASAGPVLEALESAGDLLASAATAAGSRSRCGWIATSARTRWSRSPASTTFGKPAGNTDPLLAQRAQAS